jgi:hypothetical protein
MNYCIICLKTDVFTPGRIDHDERWHELYQQYQDWGAGKDVRRPRLEFISLKGI